MSASLFLVVRILFAWAAALLVAGFMWAQLFDSIGPFFALVATGLLALAAVSSFAHLRRVRLIASRLDHDALSSRQRRQIEVPLDTGDAFELVERAVRELPRVEALESAPGSLQVRAKVRRLDPYAGRTPSRWNVFARFAITRNQVLATVTPGAGTSSVTLLCEPDAGAWVDLFAVDEGSNYENAEALGRALVRHVAG
ncbi:sensor histidine kinase, partial [Xanthomonas sp. Kuri4-2]